MKKIIILYCLALFLLVTYPLFISTGYMFSLDYLPFPLWNQKAIYGEYLYLFHLFYGITQNFIPAFVWDRIIMATTFMLAMGGMYKLINKTKNIYAILFGVTLVIINPFFYGRMLDGQANVYVAAGGVVFLIYVLKEFFEKPNLRKVILTGLYASLIPLILIHSLYFIALACCVFFVVYSIGSKNIIRHISYSLILACILIVTNYPVIAPLIYSHITPGEIKISKPLQFQEFGDDDQKIFATTTGKYGLYANTLMMKGYWGEKRGLFTPSEGKDQKYTSLIILMGLLVLLGTYSRLIARRGKVSLHLSYSIFILGICGYILSLGVSHDNIFSSVNQFLYENLPFYNGFRDPQKWMIFLVIAYSYFGGYGVEKIYQIISAFKTKIPIMVFIVLLPLINTPSMLSGFNKQLPVKHFPKEWQEMRTYIKDIPETKNCKNQKEGGNCYTFLFFPWHAYMTLNWLEKITSTIIFGYFRSTDVILFGDNAEMGTIYTKSTRPESKTIEKYVRPNQGSLRVINYNKHVSELFSFKEDMSDMGIHYVVLVKESDYAFYKKILDEMKFLGLLEIEKENSMITLYKVRK